MVNFLHPPGLQNATRGVCKFKTFCDGQIYLKRRGIADFPPFIFIPYSLTRA
jgi:hypothetical protein